MKVRVLASAPRSSSDHQYLTTFVVDDAVAIDAGCLGLHYASADGPQLRHVFITHAHIDHVCTLPLFLESASHHRNGPVRVYGSADTLRILREHLFNNRMWLDYDRLPDGGSHVALVPVDAEQTVRVGELRITAVPVVHPIPTFGYVVENGSRALVFGADSGPTDRIWEVARATHGLSAVFLECSLPSHLSDLAAKTGHLTPKLWTRELEKIPDDCTIVAVHIKPYHRSQVIAELATLADDRIQIAEPGLEYAF